MARRFWPGQNPIGKRIDLNVGGCLCEIIGVAGDARDGRLESEPGPEVYRSRSQERFTISDALLVRTALTPLALSRAVEDRLKARGLGVHLTHLKTMQDVISGSVIGPRFHTTLLGLFAGLALVLAGVGTFGVVTAFVTQHDHDIGVRLALGAQPGDVLRLVLKEGMAVILPGISIGLAGTLALSRLIFGLLYGVTPTDPLTFLGVIIVMAFAVLLACYFPSRRAMHVDPLAMLRYE
jgi:putative ABC transport system permease protein